ncbi:hypothetical protein KHA80_07170 [Anaerobacillus sp. HL2]|nr:hypothetical protein KHA80_07170 [Anaerobacillus sp. HL2]
MLIGEIIKKDKTLNTFCCQVCSGYCMVLPLRGVIPDVLTISIANTLLFIGSSFETVAILN